MSIPVSLGELIDKISILQIKSERIQQPDRLRNVRHELSLLLRIRDEAVGGNGTVQGVAAELKQVNERIWDAEEALHGPGCQTLSEAEFLRFARIAFDNNDLRAMLKRRINDLTGSDLVEEKSYPAFRLSSPAAIG